MNPALLKLELIHHGIRRGENLPETLTNPFGLVHLILPERLAVSIHLSEKEETPYTLTFEKGCFFVAGPNEEKTPVSWTPPLQSYGRKTSSGVLVGDILTVHGGFIAVHPKGPCRFGLSGLSCRYCGSSKGLTSPPPVAKPLEPPPQRPSGPGSSMEPANHPPFTKRDLVEALQIVLREKRCDIVHLSSGHVETPDGGVEWLTPWVSEIRKHLNILISLDLVPPQTNDWIDKSYAIGVDALYYDSDIFTPHFEQRRLLQALCYAAKIFPAGAVLSHLAIGLDPMEETQKNIDLLIEHGVLPILVYFPPHPGTDLARRWRVTPQQITGLYTHLYERLIRTRMTPHWVQQADVVLTPLEGRFFSQQSPRYHLALKNFYETGLGRVVRFGLASLRRHLRVIREVPIR